MIKRIFVAGGLALALLVPATQPSFAENEVTILDQTLLDAKTASEGAARLWHPQEIIADPAGGMWFASYLDVLGRITSDGSVRLYGGIGYDSRQGPRSLALMSDGTLWVGASYQVFHVDRTGQILEKFEGESSDVYKTVSIGSDGLAWWTAGIERPINRANLDGTVSRFVNSDPKSLMNNQGVVSGLTRATDGALWFLIYPRRCSVNPYHSSEVCDWDRMQGWSYKDVRLNMVHALGRITEDGQISEFPLPAGFIPDHIIAVPNEPALWIVDSQQRLLQKVGLDGKVILKMTLPITVDNVRSYYFTSDVRLSTSGDGSLWLTQQVNEFDANNVKTTRSEIYQVQGDRVVRVYNLPNVEGAVAAVDRNGDTWYLGHWYRGINSYDDLFDDNHRAQTRFGRIATHVTNPLMPIPAISEKAKAVAEAKAKAEAEAKAKAEAEAKAKAEAEAKAKAALSKKTITCIKGKSIKRVVGAKPKCPTGYKKR